MFRSLRATQLVVIGVHSDGRASIDRTFRAARAAGGEPYGMLNGSICSLVAFDERHRDATRRWANDPALGRLLDRARPVSQLEHDDWFRAVLTRSDAAFFAIEAAGRHVGNVWLWGIDPRHRKAELRIVIGDESAIGRGIGSDAIDAACRYAFGRLNLHRISPTCSPAILRAQRAFEKSGFAIEGTLARRPLGGRPLRGRFPARPRRDDAARTDAVRNNE